MLHVHDLRIDGRMRMTGPVETGVEYASVRVYLQREGTYKAYAVVERRKGERKVGDSAARSTPEEAIAEALQVAGLV